MKEHKNYLSFFSSYMSKTNPAVLLESEYGSLVLGVGVSHYRADIGYQETSPKVLRVHVSPGLFDAGTTCFLLAIFHVCSCVFIFFLCQ